MFIFVPSGSGSLLEATPNKLMLSSLSVSQKKVQKQWLVMNLCSFVAFLLRQISARMCFWSKTQNLNVPLKLCNFRRALNSWEKFWMSQTSSIVNAPTSLFPFLLLFFPCRKKNKIKFRFNWHDYQNIIFQDSWSWIHFETKYSYSQNNW